MSRLSEIVEILQYSPSSTTATTNNAEPPTVFELPIGKDEDEKVEPTSLSPTQPPSSEQSSSQPSSPLPVTFPLEIHQTHISVVALTNECAYKLKKPVNFGFLDFSTLQQRFLACVNEVLLNKRLSPYLYLSVVRVRVQERRGKTKVQKKNNKKNKQNKIYRLNILVC